MGCDIHTHLEIKLDNTWHYFAPVDFWRDYALFAKMAGVRNVYEIEPISNPRGLPKDVSFMTQFHSDYLGVDGHSHSWLSFDEMTMLLRWINENLGYKPWGARGQENQKTFDKFADFGVWLFGNSIKGLREYPESYPNSLQDVRLVFWFDN